MGVWSRYLYRRRKIRERISEFRLDIATPEILGSEAAGGSFTYVMKAAARLAISADEITERGDLKINDYTIEAAEAGQIMKGPYLEENEEVTIETVVGTPALNFTLYVLDFDDKPYAVATGVVT